MIVQPFGFLAGAAGGAAGPILTDLTFWVDASDSSSYPGSGATWFDLTANSRDLTISNSPTYDGTNKIFEFNGSSQDAKYFPPAVGDEFFDTSDNDNWAVTWEAVIRLDDLTGANEPIITRWSNTATNNQRIIFALESGQVRLALRSNGGSSTFPLSTSIGTSGWHHLYMILERVSGGTPTYAVYLDNSSLMSGSWTGFSSWYGANTSMPLSVGRTYTPQYFDGGIAMARIYNQALGASDRTHNYDLAKSIWTSIP